MIQVSVEGITDAQKFMESIKSIKYKIEALSYAKYLEKNGLVLRATDPSKPLIPSGTNVDLSSHIVKVEALAKTIDDELTHLYTLRSRGKQLIELLPDYRMQAVMRMYYIDFVPWKEVSYKMHISPSRLYELRRIAIFQLNDKIRAARLRQLTKLIKQVAVAKSR